MKQLLTICSVFLLSTFYIGSASAANTVTSADIVDKTIKGKDISNRSIGGVKLKTSSIGTANFKIGAVTEVKIADGAVTGAKIAGTAAAANSEILTADGAGGAAWLPAPSHQGAVYRWNRFSSYSQAFGWMAGNNATLFGGVAPSTWTDGNGLANAMSADKEVLRTLFTRKGYGGTNALVYADEWVSFSSTNGQMVTALFRIKNTTTNPIVWAPDFYYSAFSGWGGKSKRRSQWNRPVGERGGKLRWNL